MSKSSQFSYFNQDQNSVSDIDYLSDIGYLDRRLNGLDYAHKTSQNKNYPTEVFDPYEQYYPFLDGQQAHPTYSNNNNQSHYQELYNVSYNNVNYRVARERNSPSLAYRNRAILFFAVILMFITFAIVTAFILRFNFL